MLDATTVHHYLDTHLDTPQVNKVQHGFPSPRFWTEPHVPTDQIAADRRALRAARRDTPVNLYVGVPYCIATDPGKCGYCLLAVSTQAGSGPHFVIDMPPGWASTVSS